MNTNPSKSLIRAAQRALASPFFLAATLQDYQQANQLDNEALANLLGCHVDDLTRLALCRRPISEQQTFTHDIDHLAQRFHLHADQLAEIIRQVDALAAFRHQMISNQQATHQSLLAAARDRQNEVSEGTENNND
ncbi:MAG: hypothetical protein PVS3B3_08970 [Ktedonobacteraceae bacterium]